MADRPSAATDFYNKIRQKLPLAVQLPLYPRKQTQPGNRRMSEKCPTAEMHDRDQDAETVLTALRMTSRTTLGFDSMGT